MSDVESDDDSGSILVPDPSFYRVNGQRASEHDAWMVTVETNYLSTGADVCSERGWQAEHSIRFLSGRSAAEIYTPATSTSDTKGHDEAETEVEQTHWIESFSNIAGRWIVKAMVFYRPMRCGQQMMFSFSRRRTAHTTVVTSESRNVSFVPASKRIFVNYNRPVAAEINHYIGVIANEPEVKSLAREILTEYAQPDELRLALIIDVFARNVVCGPFGVVLPEPDLRPED
jgi:hypothetical protein